MLLKKHALRPDTRVAVVGVGAELNGDDAVGLRVADRLASLVGQQENLLVLNGGSLPESTSGALRRFHPTLVLFVDAADLGKTAGAIEVLETQRVGGASFSTHGMPLIMLMDYLAEELGCESVLIGVQPERVDFDSPLSDCAKRAATRLAKELYRLLAVPNLDEEELFAKKEDLGV